MRQPLVFVVALAAMVALTFAFSSAVLGSWRHGWRHARGWAVLVACMAGAGGAIGLVML